MMPCGTRPSKTGRAMIDLQDIAGDLALDYLAQTELGEKAEQALRAIESAQAVLAGLEAQANDKDLLGVKVGTVLCFAVLGKAQAGTSPFDYTRDDWASIASEVAEWAVIADGQAYSEQVFLLYAGYIDASADLLATVASPASVDATRALADRLRSLSKTLEAGEIGEVEYTERCLWTCLEAMLKLLSALLGSAAGAELELLSTSVAQLAFEYGRYRLYAKEQLLLEEYLDHQREVDAQLEEELRAYRAQLEEEAERFLGLVDAAFDPDIESRLRNSVTLARAAGVSEEDVLDSLARIDDFFLN